MRPMVDWRICSNSDSGNAGSRKTSAASCSASGNPAWTVLMETVAPLMAGGGGRHLRFQFIQLILNLLARMLGGAAHQHRAP